jgi:hypothetical protein
MDVVKLVHIPPQPLEFLTHESLCQVCRKPTGTKPHRNEELTQYVDLLNARQTGNYTYSNRLELSYNRTLCVILGSVSGSGMFEI